MAPLEERMAEPSGRAIVERYARALQDKDFDALALLLADDYVDELPQSGERVRGRANALAYLRSYAGGLGTIEPTSARLVGCGGPLGAHANVRAPAHRGVRRRL